MQKVAGQIHQAIRACSNHHNNRTFSSFSELGKKFQEKRIEYEKNLSADYRPNKLGEFGELNRTDGKLWKPMIDLIDEKKAVVVPKLGVTTVEGEPINLYNTTHGNVTLLLTSYKHFGYNMLDSWYNPFEAASADKSRVKVLRLNITEEPYLTCFKFITSRVTSDLKSRVSRQELYRQELTYFNSCTDFRSKMNMKNSFVGYAHLIDHNARVRWQAAGTATDEELSLLFKHTRTLQKLLPQ